MGVGTAGRFPAAPRGRRWGICLRGCASTPRPGGSSRFGTGRWPRKSTAFFNFQARLEGGKTPANVLAAEEIEGLPRTFLVPKPKKEEKGAYNHHPTVKPLALLRHLIRLASPEGGLVLDPFLGSGSTGVAALLEGRRILGIERNPDYLEVARLRLQEAAFLQGERERG